MRVATRRLRAVLEIYAPCFPPRRAPAVLRDVKALADALGARRDPDVQLAALAGMAERLDPRRPRRPGGPSPTACAPTRRAGNERARARPWRKPRRTTSRAAAGARRAGRAGATAPRVKARRVKGLDPAGPLADKVERIVRVAPRRAAPLHPGRARPRRGRGAARHADRGQAPALHPGDDGRAVLRPVRRARRPSARSELQDLLGEIHDCDETLPRVLALAEELRDTDATRARLAAGDAADLDPALVAADARTPRPAAGCRRWPSSCRRAARCSTSASWSSGRELGREGFRARLEYAVTERPPSRRSSPPSAGPRRRRRRRARAAEARHMASRGAERRPPTVGAAMQRAADRRSARSRSAARAGTRRGARPPPAAPLRQPRAVLGGLQRPRAAARRGRGRRRCWSA